VSTFILKPVPTKIVLDFNNSLRYTKSRKQTSEGIMFRVYFTSFDYSKFYATYEDAEKAGKQSGFSYTISRV
jgi:hypothetical protein